LGFETGVAAGCCAPAENANDDTATIANNENRRRIVFLW
jgi:hypothetical protein